jgi:hypothetical protein
MNDNGSVIGLVATATTIQVVYTLSKGGDPVPNIITAGVFLLMLVILGYALGGNSSIPKAIAGVTLLAVILGRGYPVILQVNKFLNGFAVSPTPIRKK